MFKTLLLVNFRGVKRILIFDFVIFQKLGEFIRFSSDFQILLNFHQKKLDDGWPESVEEQSLLLLVWRHYITR